MVLMGAILIYGISSQEIQLVAMLTVDWSKVDVDEEVFRPFSWTSSDVGVEDVCVVCAGIVDDDGLPLVISLPSSATSFIDVGVLFATISSGFEDDTLLVVVGGAVVSVVGVVLVGRSEIQKSIGQ